MSHVDFNPRVKAERCKNIRSLQVLLIHTRNRAEDLRVIGWPRLSSLWDADADYIAELINERKKSP